MAAERESSREPSLIGRKAEALGGNANHWSIILIITNGS